MTEAAVIRGRPRREATIPYGSYAVASLGLMAIATANGIVRELTYAKYLNEETAHRLSLVPMVLLFGLYVDQLERRWPLPTWRGAVGVGAMWATIAVGFELGVGHYVDGKSWSELLREYNLLEGRSGGLVVAWTVAVPYVIRSLKRYRSGCQSG
jgi:hypothetical protein